MSDDEEVTIFMPTAFFRHPSSRARATQTEPATPVVANSQAPSSPIPCVGSKSAGETYFGDTLIGGYPDEPAAPVLAPAAEPASLRIRPRSDARVSPSGRTSPTIVAQVKRLLERLARPRAQLAYIRSPNATKYALGMLGLFIGVTFAVVVSSGRARGPLTAPAVQKSASEPTGKLDQELEQPTIDEPNRGAAPLQVQEPVHKEAPLQVQESSQVDKKEARPFIIYAISGDYTARAKQALLWTLSGQCERAVANYRALIVDDTENTPLYESLLVEAERRCSLREVQP